MCETADDLELPVLLDGFDGPFELLAQGLGEELLNGYVELLAEDDGETGVDIILQRPLDDGKWWFEKYNSQSWRCPERLPCCLPCLELGQT